MHAKVALSRFTLRDEETGDPFACGLTECFGALEIGPPEPPTVVERCCAGLAWSRSEPLEPGARDISGQR